MMHFSKIVLVLILTVFIKDSRSQNFPAVPCPAVFEYLSSEDRILGLITIPTPKEGKWTILNVSIGTNSEVINNERFLNLYKSKNETAVDAQNGRPVKYIMLIPLGTEIPVIKNIYLNGEVICRGKNVFYHNNWSFKHRFYFGKTDVRIEYTSNTEEIFPTVLDWFIAQSKHVSSLSNLKMTPTTVISPRMGDDGSWLKYVPFKCGLKQSTVQKRTHTDLKPASLILNGTVVKKGEFPWLVYFEYDTTGTHGTICGGTLVSDRHIITAAHCVKDYRVVAVHLGKHVIYAKETGSVKRVPRATVAHPEYKPMKAHADIAIVIVDPVPFSLQIFPACIWPFGLHFDENFQYGTVAGWGVYINEYSAPHSRIPMKTNVPIVSVEMCRQSHEVLQNLTTDDIICAGGEYKGPCYGDSGSGLYFLHMNTWYLRGIVSTSLTDERMTCKIDEYATYVDIAFYLDWLRPFITDTENEVVRITSRIDTRFKNKAKIVINS